MMNAGQAGYWRKPVSGFAADAMRQIERRMISGVHHPKLCDSAEQ
jgi:hypothetical protein